MEIEGITLAKTTVYRCPRCGRKTSSDSWGIVNPIVNPDIETTSMVFVINNVGEFHFCLRCIIDILNEKLPQLRELKEDE